MGLAKQPQGQHATGDLTFVFVTFDGWTPMGVPMGPIEFVEGLVVEGLEYLFGELHGGQKLGFR